MGKSEELRSELAISAMEIEMQELELEEMIQKRARLKEEFRKKKSKMEKVRTHKLIVFAAAFFSNFRESAKNEILDLSDTDLEKIANVVFRVYRQSYRQSVKSLKKK